MTQEMEAMNSLKILNLKVLTFKTCYIKHVDLNNYRTTLFETTSNY